MFLLSVQTAFGNSHLSINVLVDLFGPEQLFNQSLGSKSKVLTLNILSPRSKKKYKLFLLQFFASHYFRAKNMSHIGSLIDNSVTFIFFHELFNQTDPNLLKFIYSEKATKFYEIFTLLLTGTTQDKIKVEISPNFVAFSEYMNFNLPPGK